MGYSWIAILAWKPRARVEQTEPMLQAWRDRCPIYLALLKPNPIDLKVAHAAA